MQYLWTQLIAKVKGAVKLLHAFSHLHKRMYLAGTSKKGVTYDLFKTQKPFCFILMPSSRIRKGWSLLTYATLVYTAVFVPYTTVFEDDTPANEWNGRQICD